MILDEIEDFMFCTMDEAIEMPRNMIRSMFADHPYSDVVITHGEASRPCAGEGAQGRGASSRLLGCTFS